jgi:hypothetical protein
MPLSWEKFKGTLPYASEVFGIYQPLLGWRARQAKKRIFVDRVIYLRGVLLAMKQDWRVVDALQTQLRPMSPDTALPSMIGSLPPASVRALQKAVDVFQEQHKRAPSDAEWSAVVKSVDFGTVLKNVGANSPGNPAAAANMTAPAGAAVVGEAVMAGTFDYLARQAPAVLRSMFIDAKADWQIAPGFFNPISAFGLVAQDTVLSPIGIVQLFRQYFYEFRTFLGTPVGHVWVSPGGTVEVFEIQTRKQLEERYFEVAGESTSKSETASQLDDELSTKVAVENSRDTKLGVSASGGANVGVYHAEAHADYSLQTTNKSAEETAHKRSRQQSEKLSEEIRRSFKTTFRTTVETQNSSSRRYVITNTTDKLVNYELRRKMRQVGVQVQHIGTQLCWQAYVDQPGSELGVGELVHIAKPDDMASAALKPPESPAILPPIQSLFHIVYHLGDNPVFEPALPAPGYVIKAVAPRIEEPERHFQILAGGKTFQFILDGSGWTQYDYWDDLTISWDQADRGAEEAAYKAKLSSYTQEKQRLQQEEYVKAVRERVNLAGQVRKRPAEDLREEERTVVFRQLIRQLTLTEDREPHLVSELIRSIFDIEAMLYFVAPEWWKPNVARFKQQYGGQSKILGENLVGWGGVAQAGRDNYYVTEDSEPAPMGASLGWLLQLDGDEHRNAFVNSPWVKGVIPIRPGHEQEAMEWLQKQHVEGTDGLIDKDGKDTALKKSLYDLSDKIAEMNAKIENQLATEKVFEKGFDPLGGGFRAPGNPDPGTPYALFDQWIEVLPTDQVVALEYKPDDSLG